MKKSKAVPPARAVRLPEHKPRQNRHPNPHGNAFVTIEEAAAQLARRRPR